MSTDSYTTTVHIARPPRDVFDAINDVRGWWSEEVDGDTDRAGAEFSFRGHDDAETVEHLSRIRVVDLVPGERVVWRVLENHMSFVEDQTEWEDTEIRFELSGSEAGTLLHFTHVGLVPDFECFDVCRDAWGFYIRTSLPGLVTTGQGSPIRRTVRPAVQTGAGVD